VQPDPGRDAHAGAQRRRLGRRLLKLVGLGHRHGAWAQADRPGLGPALPQPPEIQQGEQADPEADRVDQPEGGELSPAGLPLGCLLQGVLHRVGGVDEDLEQEEHQDAG
jgi:hypothetical protein